MISNGNNNNTVIINYKYMVQNTYIKNKGKEINNYGTKYNGLGSLKVRLPIESPRRSLH